MAWGVSVVTCLYLYPTSDLIVLCRGVVEFRYDMGGGGGGVNTYKDMCMICILTCARGVWEVLYV